MDEIRTLIVEDDPMVGQINSRYIHAQEGFSLAALLGSGKEALDFLRDAPRSVDLMLLDIFMPELDGLETLREIRRLGVQTDVIVVSAASDPLTINEAIRDGAFDYITKPFQPERLFQSLEAFRKMKKESGKKVDKFCQEDIDKLFALRNRKQSYTLPKGLSRKTLDRVKAELAGVPQGASANEVGEKVGISRVTVRRYLEFLVFTGEASLERHFQEVGRPVNRYRLF